MSQNPADVTNPGSVNVANEGFGRGPVAPNQPVTLGPGTNPGPIVPADREAPGRGPDSPDQPVTVSPSQNAGVLGLGGLIQGGSASPTSPNCQNTTENTVVNQIYGTGTPKNVYP
jgi:hypothetical protein